MARRCTGQAARGRGRHGRLPPAPARPRPAPACPPAGRGRRDARAAGALSRRPAGSRSGASGAAGEPRPGPRSWRGTAVPPARPAAAPARPARARRRPRPQAPRWRRWCRPAADEHGAAAAGRPARPRGGPGACPDSADGSRARSCALRSSSASAGGPATVRTPPTRPVPDAGRTARTADPVVGRAAAPGREAAPPPAPTLCRVPQLRLALAQVNPTVGDLEGNAELVAAYARQAADAGAHLVALPEMALTGYPIEDLALRASFVEAARKQLVELAARLAADGLGDLPVVLGCLDRVEGATETPGVPKGSPQDAVAVLHGGRVVVRQAKHHLWNYGVGDEIRYFVPGDTVNVVRVGGVDIALAVCEDIWRDGPSAAAAAAGAGLLLVVNGSPYERDKDDTRLDLCRRRAAEAGCPLGWVNLVGGQDELVFDGDSIVVGRDGTLLARGEPFAEQLLVVDLELRAATDDPLPERAGNLRLVRTLLSDEPVAPYAAGAARDRRPARRRRRDVAGDHARTGRLRAQERLRVGAAGDVGRDRLDGRRPAGVRRRRRRQRARRVQPQRLVDRALPLRRRRARAAYRAAPAHRADRRPGRRVRTCPARPRRARGREPAGADPGRDLDGAVQRRGPSGAGVRQQVRAGHRLLDHLRRCRGRLRADQGRAQDAGLGARAVAQRGGRDAAASSRRSRRPRSRSRRARSCGRASSTPTRCPTTPCSTTSSTTTSSATRARSTWWRWASTARWSST